MKKKIIYTDAPPEIEEAFARSKRIPNFIDIDSLVRRDGTRPSFETTPQLRRSDFRKVAAML